MAPASARRVERDEDLALFHDMQRREHERRSSAMRPVSDNTANSSEAHPARMASSSLLKMATAAAAASGNLYRARTSGEELLASDMGKNDYDWLLTPPGTPLVTGSENDPMADMAFLSAQRGLPNLVRSLATIKTIRGGSRESSARSDPGARIGRSTMPTRRSSLAPTSSTPSSRPVSRPSTPTSRPIIPSSNASSSKLSTAGSSLPDKMGISSRSTTPIRRPSTPASMQPRSQPFGRSSSAGKLSSLPSRNTPVSRGSSPTIRTHQAWQPPAMPEFSLEPPPNLRTTIPARSVSNTRGASISSSQQTQLATAPTTASTRPGMSSSTPARLRALSSPSRPLRPGTSLLSTRPGILSTSLPSSTSPSSSRTADITQASTRRQSCSPSLTRGRTSTRERPLSRNGRGDSSPCDTTGRGGKVVDRLMQSRRAAASLVSPDEQPSTQLKRPVKPMSPSPKDNSAYGKSLSRKSIDLALRQMDIRQSASNGLRPLVSAMPTSSFYSVRSVNGRGVRPGHSPLATSSTASSDYSMSIVRDLEGSSELGEEVCSEAGSRASPRSASDVTYSAAKEARVTRWMDSPDFSREDSVELIRMFRRGIEKQAGLESPLVCHHHHHHQVGGKVSCELCNLKSRLQSLKASPMSAESMMMSSYSSSSNGVPSPASSHH